MTAWAVWKVGGKAGKISRRTLKEARKTEAECANCNDRKESMARSLDFLVDDRPLKIMEIRGRKMPRRSSFSAQEIKARANQRSSHIGAFYIKFSKAESLKRIPYSSMEEMKYPYLRHDAYINLSLVFTLSL